MTSTPAATETPTTEPQPDPTATETPTTEPQPEPTSSIVVSNRVPSLQELMDMGIEQPSAECFIETIDPNGTGQVANVDLFMAAFGACL